MSPRAKVKAGGILRTSIDTAWGTPEFVLERARLALGGAIPFDPATRLDNPTKAVRYCAGPPGTLFQSASSINHVGCPMGCDCSGCDLVRSNGLNVSWDWPWWVNPPFNKEWIKKIGVEADRARVDGRACLALFPCNRQEEDFFHETFSQANFVCYVQAKPFQPAAKSRPNRIAFISSKDGVALDKNPFASMILGFNFGQELFTDAFGIQHPQGPLGACYRQEPVYG